MAKLKRSIFRNLSKSGSYKKQYISIISKLIKIKKILMLVKEISFVQICENLLTKRLYSLGLIKNSNNIYTECITYDMFRQRRINHILVSQGYAASINHANKLIKKRKIFIGSKKIDCSKILINRETENNIRII